MKKKNILIASVASLVVLAATTFLIIKRQKEKGEAPPHNAPQLDLDNPGDQSEFPSGPSGNVELG